MGCFKATGMERQRGSGRIGLYGLESWLPSAKFHLKVLSFCLEHALEDSPTSSIQLPFHFISHFISRCRGCNTLLPSSMRFTFLAMFDRDDLLLHRVQVDEVSPVKHCIESEVHTEPHLRKYAFTPLAQIDQGTLVPHICYLTQSQG